MVAKLQRLLQEKADPKVKSWWENYVKEGAPFRGVPMPAIRSLLHGWHKETVSGVVDIDGQADLSLALLRAQYAEDKLAGILFVQEILLPAGGVKVKRDVGQFASLFSQGYIYDWNICDWFCVKLLGPLIAGDSPQWAEDISQWRNAKNLWQARASVVPFTKVADDRGHYPNINKSCYALIRREERFAKTAVGWVLRDISKHDPSFVRQFMDRGLRYFSMESLRNALKYFDNKERDSYVEMLKHAHRV